MKRYAGKSFVTTVKELCRVCYACVRECPAKAIRIVDGQAEIIGERCINCGNCVKVCSQGAKRVIDTTQNVKDILETGVHAAACVAPSFPAEFSGCSPGELVGMLKRLGFSSVHEVGFGADLVSDRYKRLLDETSGKKYISTSCPAVISYIEKYLPELVDSLAPVVSPMTALARALRSTYPMDIKVVFIGPCIAKKQESVSERLNGVVDAAITFVELRALLEEKGITPDKNEVHDFDPPLAGLGSLYSLSRGFIQASGMKDDMLHGDVVTADGRTGFLEAIAEFKRGDMEAKLLEVLCCTGCIMGPGIKSDIPYFRRRSLVTKYVRDYVLKRDTQTWRAQMAGFSDLDLTRTFNENDQRISNPVESELVSILAKMGKTDPKDELNCGACGYETCREHAIAIHKGLAENEMCLPYTIDRLNKANMELAISNEQLATTQKALLHSEKLASMGQLAAGIAHEVNNPLGVVLLYSHLLREEYSSEPRLNNDLTLITEQAERCKKIVAGLLGFARQSKVILEPTDVRELVERSLQNFPDRGKIEVDVKHDLENPIAELDRDQIIQVLTNLISNAIAAMPDGGKLEITTSGTNENINLKVADTGIGIPKENIGKIFDPFFTTKQIGEGTGLGLAVTYGIVKMHYGDITVESNDNSAQGPTGSLFTVTLPRFGVAETI